jgi:Kef-type K+ transport system membrane component KefB/Trk K+ transport system NAD-binding subunit
VTLFFEVALLLSLTMAIALVMHRLKQPLILAYLVSGIIAGPQVLGLIHSEETLSFLSKLGITSLLFIVGLSLSPKVVREVGSVSISAGLGQVIFTATFGFLIALLFGYTWVSALYIAIGLTFSSTIIAMKFLQDKRELGTVYGKISIGILLVQDVAATIVLVLITAFSAGAADLNTFAIVLLKAVLLSLFVAAVSKLILPTLTKIFATSQEFLLLFSVAWGTGVAALFQYAGFSIEIGALAAGVALSTSAYHYEISSKMKILRDFLVAIFFIVLGSELRFNGAGELVFPAIIFSLFVLIGNPLILTAIMGFMGYGRNVSFRTGIAMAQISEFSLVLMALAYQLGHIDERVVLLVTIVGMTTFAVSSYMLAGSDWLTEKLWDQLAIFERKKPKIEKRKVEKIDAILFGCHRLGRDFLPLLKSSYKKYLVVDFDPATIEDLKRSKVPAMYGDADDNEFLDELDLQNIKLVISTLPDTETNLFILNKVRRENDEAIVILMAHSAEEALLLYKNTADYVVLPHFLGGSYATLLLDKYGLDADQFATEREKHLKHLKTRLGESEGRLPAMRTGA